MAAELKRDGLSVRIIDKDCGRTDRSKAIVVWARTLELLDRTGAGFRPVATAFSVCSYGLQGVAITWDDAYGRAYAQGSIEKSCIANLFRPPGTSRHSSTRELLCIIQFNGLRRCRSEKGA
jgi:hypothetical protein